MKTIRYKISIIIALVTILVQAQKNEKSFTKELTIKKGAEVVLIANYTDIEIIEWNKKKVQVKATMTVEGVSKEVAQTYFDTWEMDLKREEDKIKIISKSKKHYPIYLELGTDIDIASSIFEMPEISIESLGVLDTMSFSYPEINFDEVFNDSTFNKIFTYKFNAELDSLGNRINKFDFEKLKNNQKYLQEWQEANKDNFIKLRERALEIAIRKKEIKRNKKKIAITRKELAKKRAKMAKKRVKVIKKKSKERHKEIKRILKNRKEAKVRTKLTIKVPKGTDFDMNVNYSKIRTN